MRPMAKKSDSWIINSMYEECSARRCTEHVHRRTMIESERDAAASCLGEPGSCLLVREVFPRPGLQVDTCCC